MSRGQSSAPMAPVATVDGEALPDDVWQRLQEERELLVMANGRPLALLISADSDDFEELLLALRRARAQLALARLRQQAAEMGLDHLSLDEINTEIEAARHEREARQSDSQAQ